MEILMNLRVIIRYFWKARDGWMFIQSAVLSNDIMSLQFWARSADFGYKNFAVLCISKLHCDIKYLCLEILCILFKYIFWYYFDVMLDYCL
jgi:hypothetical protein